jgi:hypothetical protein
MKPIEYPPGYLAQFWRRRRKFIVSDILQFNRDAYQYEMKEIRRLRRLAKEAEAERKKNKPDLRPRIRRPRI